MSQDLSSSSWDDQDEHVSLKANFQSYDQHFYTSDNKQGEITDLSKLPKLWPLCTRFKEHEHAGCFSLHAGQGIYLANPECQQALDVTAFREWLESYGFPTHIVGRSSEADILIYVKNTLCPVNGSFELQVRSNRIILIGNDFHGVVYGLLALKQVLTNHTTSTTHEEHGRVLQVPNILMSSSPAVAKRAVMWSYQYNVFASRDTIATSLRMLSNLRINHLLLVFDGAVESIDIHGDFASKFATDLANIKDMCQQLKITLIPTVLLESPVDWEIGLRALKLNSKESIFLFFNYTATNLVKDMNNGDIAADICFQYVRGIMSDVKKEGFKSIIFSRSKFVHDATRIEPSVSKCLKDLIF